MESHFGYGAGNGCFAAQSEQCGEKLMHPTTAKLQNRRKAKLIYLKGGKRAEDSKFRRSVYFANRLSHCIWVNLPTVKPKL